MFSFSFVLGEEGLELTGYFVVRTVFTGLTTI